jgi:hypothetical protein
MDEDLYKKLVVLLKIFHNRPHHLARYLLETDAFNKKFTSTLSGFDLIDIDEKFRNIQEINDYFNRFLVSNQNPEGKEKKKEKDLNDQLYFLLEQERYEDAARVRDYMIKNKIKIRESE